MASLSPVNTLDASVYEDVFMLAALKEAEIALEEGEVPVGCVLVRLETTAEGTATVSHSTAEEGSSFSAMTSETAVVEGRILSTGRNATNRRHHALAHAEFMALEKLQQKEPLLDDTLAPGSVMEQRPPLRHAQEDEANACELPCFPHAATSLREGVGTSLDSPNGEACLHIIPCALYVTVEPCLMCAAMLRYHQFSYPTAFASTSTDHPQSRWSAEPEGRQRENLSSVCLPWEGKETTQTRERSGGSTLSTEEKTTSRTNHIGIKNVQYSYRISHVFYGCGNPRFGGNGSVLGLHHDAWWRPHQHMEENEEGERSHDGAPHTFSSSSQENRNAHPNTALTFGTSFHDVHQWEPPPYVSEGGHREAEAIALLQAFYQRENKNAPGHKRRRKFETAETSPTSASSEGPVILDR